MDEELQKILKYLRLGGLLANWDSLLAEARQGKFSHERLLRHVLQAEYRSKGENARLLRRKRAHIPEPWELETYPFGRQTKLDRQRILSLYDSFDYMLKKRNLIWLGPTGCGKTGLASAFLLQAIDRGYVEVEPVQVGLFFTLMQKRYQTRTTLITSNLGFRQWGSFLKNPHLTAALIDRLTSSSHVINMKNCGSMRPRLDSEKESDDPPDADS